MGLKFEANCKHWSVQWAIAYKTLEKNQKKNFNKIYHLIVLSLSENKKQKNRWVEFCKRSDTIKVIVGKNWWQLLFFLRNLKYKMETLSVFYFILSVALKSLVFPLWCGLNFWITETCVTSFGSHAQNGAILVFNISGLDKI